MLEETYRTAVGVIEATANRPLGLLAMVLFVGGVVTFLINRAVNPRASVPAFWIMCVGCAALAYQVSEIRLAPGFARTQAGRVFSDPNVPTLPDPTLPSAGPSGGDREIHLTPLLPPVETERSSNTADAPRGDLGSPRAAAPVASARWVPDGVVTESLTTQDHTCPDIDSCRKTYTMTMRSGLLRRLTAPELRCVEGGCAAGAVKDVRVSRDGQRIVARVEVWGLPTRWELRAVKEVRVGQR